MNLLRVVLIVPSIVRSSAILNEDNNCWRYTRERSNWSGIVPVRSELDVKLD